MKFGHIAARCPNRKDKDEEREQESIKIEEMIEVTEDTKTTKEKVRNPVILLKKITDTDSDDFEIEVVYVAMKDESDEDEIKLH